MSAFKGTTGPWAVRVEEQHYVTSAEGRIANVLFPRYSADGAEVMANARLIAAAPDLLEAMEDLVLMYGRRGGVDPTSDALLPEDQQPEEVRNAMAAIAKATGGVE